MDLISSIRARLPHYPTKANRQESVVGVQPFCRNKNHPDHRKERLCPSQKRRSATFCVDTGWSAGLRCARQGDNKCIHQQRGCKHQQTAAMQKTESFYHFIHCEVEFGGLEVYPGRFHLAFQSLALADVEPSPAAPVAWKQHCCINMKKRVDLISWSLFELD